MSLGPDDGGNNGEVVDRLAHDAIRLAHRALDRFPEVVTRHKVIAGGAAVSSSLIVLAGVALARRMRNGQTADEALESLTEDEIQGHYPEDDTDPAEASDDSESHPHVRRNGATRPERAHPDGVRERG